MEKEDELKDQIRHVKITMISIFLFFIDLIRSQKVLFSLFLVIS